MSWINSNIAKGLPQANFFSVCLKKVSVMTISLGKLELKCESAKGQKQTLLRYVDNVRFRG